MFAHLFMYYYCVYAILVVTEVQRILLIFKKCHDVVNVKQIELEKKRTNNIYHISDKTYFARGEEYQLKIFQGCYMTSL